MGAGETSHGKGYKCLTVVVDHDRGCLVWAHEGYGGGRRRVELLEPSVLVPGRDPHLASPLSLLPLLLISCCICPALSAWRNPPGPVVCLVKPDLRVGTAVVILGLFLHCQLGVVKPNWTIS